MLPDVYTGTQTNMIKSFGKKLKEKCIRIYVASMKDKLRYIREDENSKLYIYSLLKDSYQYESYLNIRYKHINELTKFRLSMHWLPIERNRYCREKLDRNKRICTLCTKYLGSEFHALIECNHDSLR